MTMEDKRKLQAVGLIPATDEDRLGAMEEIYETPIEIAEELLEKFKARGR